jgi:hypothetical protein
VSARTLFFRPSTCPISLSICCLLATLFAVLVCFLLIAQNTGDGNLLSRAEPAGSRFEGHQSRRWCAYETKTRISPLCPPLSRLCCPSLHSALCPSPFFNFNFVLTAFCCPSSSVQHSLDVVCFPLQLSPVSNLLHSPLLSLLTRTRTIKQ